MTTSKNIKTDLEKLAEQISQCSRCALREGATAPVPGLGLANAKYFLLGEAPGKSEDQTSTPFVGSAGRRLDKLLALAKINPNDCFITNVVKCRPPKNRTPRKAERLACYVWLKKELQLVKPKTIITLGATPLGLFTDVGISQLHGTQMEIEIDID